MIQEKDFLYRVPVKTAPITTPGGQIRNPEILVDIEGGEFMHGNILDANSTNKLINQSVDKITEVGYVTKNLLDAETTRATAKENEIKAQVDIINGDSTTEGSFRKAIADVVAAAPEDLDTLKEIADKLAGNDDLHTALNQAITEKADASALLNEVTRATGAESGLQAAIATKADATALSNYVLTTALNQQVDTLNAALAPKADRSDLMALEQKITANTTALEAKQDKGNYMEYSSKDDGEYTIDCELNTSEPITIDDKAGHRAFVTVSGIQADDDNTGKSSQLTASSLVFSNGIKTRTIYTADGITSNQHNDCLATSDGTFKPISDFVLKEDQDIEYVSYDQFYNWIDSVKTGLSSKQNKITVNSVDVTNLETADITQLRAIVKDLLTALDNSGLIISSSGVE